MKKALSLCIVVASVFFVTHKSFAAYEIPSPLILTQNLSLDSTGNEVSLLQKFLTNQGFFNYPTITGRFGPITKLSVQTFQAKNSLDADGIVGPITRAKIAGITPISGSVVTQPVTPLVNHYVINVTQRDTTPPTIPTDLVASNVGQNILSLSWTASTDKSGVHNYTLDRCTGGTCTDFSKIATPLINNYEDSMLSPNTTYRYRVAAFDEKGNLSAYSEIVNVTTLTIPTFALTVNKSGTGSGIIMSLPAGIDCGATCINLFNSGTVVSLNASAAAGSAFTGWGGACSGTGLCSVTLDQARSVTATFRENEAPLVAITAPVPSVISTCGTGIYITASATDNIGVASVDFKIYTVPEHTLVYSSTDVTAPYSAGTDPLTDGNYMIEVTATDTSGNTATDTKGFNTIFDVGLCA
jgi:hypothetical protein